VNPVAEEAWIEEGLSFLSKLYGGGGMTSLADLRSSIFSKKKDPPKIKSLPPTDDAAVQHIRRARLQVLIWRAADQAAPPDIDVTQYGWKFDNNVLNPVAGTSPPSVLQSIACSCKSASPCANQMQEACHALHTASVVLMTSAQISTHNLRLLLRHTMIPAMMNLDNDDYY